MQTPYTSTHTSGNILRFARATERALGVRRSRRNLRLVSVYHAETGEPTCRASYMIAKRILDVAVAATMLTLLAPVLLVTALLIKLTSPGSIIFRQLRTGKNGREFWCYKFRSMCADAEAKKAALMHLNEASGPVFKIKRDPRITAVGAVIRKLSIDELPQLFNVLRGDMSLVGPRPPLPAEVAHYTDYQRGRLAVTPGLTCIWQISGRSEIGFEKWVELDMQYIRSMSMATDLKILWKTVPAVLFGHGAS